MIKKLGQERFTREAMEPTKQGLDRREGERREMSPHQEYLEARLARFIKRSLIAFSVLGVTCVVALLGFGIVLTRQQTITDDIQQQRYDAFLTSCTEQNVRNHDVNARIDDAIADLPPKGRAKAELKAKPFRLILNAAVPLKSDCVGYANTRTGH